MKYGLVILIYFAGSLISGKDVTLTYKSLERVNSVSVAGDFNNWNSSKNPMVLMGDSIWTITLQLQPGEYQYRFFIDGEKWTKDPQNPIWEGWRSNSLLFVYSPGTPVVSSITPQDGEVLNNTEVTMVVEFDRDPSDKISSYVLYLNDKKYDVMHESESHTIRQSLQLKPGDNFWRFEYGLENGQTTPIYRGLWTVNPGYENFQPNAGYLYIVNPGEIFSLNGGLSKSETGKPFGGVRWRWNESYLSLKEGKETLYPKFKGIKEGLSKVYLTLGEQTDSSFVLAIPVKRDTLSLEYDKKALEQAFGPINNVYVAGDFNNWQMMPEWQLNISGNRMSIKHEIASGKYEYKLIINGTKWVVDPENSLKIEDGWNGENSIVEIGYDIDRKQSLSVIYDGTILGTSFTGMIFGDRNSDSRYRFRQWEVNGSSNIEIDAQSPLLFHALKQIDGGFEEPAAFYLSASEIEPLGNSPAWADSAIIYEVFIRQFGGTENGTLNHVRSKIPYLKELGINTIWLTPVYEGPTEHGYAPTDFFRIESDYGTMQDFEFLIAECHRNDIRVIFDFVANHTSDQHPYFLASRNANSYYRDWYYWDSNGNYGYNDTWDVLPDLRWENPNVRNYMLDVANFWIDKGVDGFRADAAWGVPHSFWKDLRIIIKSRHPEFLLIDEVLPRSPEFHKNEFDASYDTDFYGNVLDLFNGKKSLKGLIWGMQKTKFYYPAQTLDLRYIENHDMERFVAQFGEDAAKLAGTLLFLSPGMPLIYYGQETGLAEMRPLMDWKKTNENNAFYSLYRQLIRLRKKFKIGAFQKDIEYTEIESDLLKIEQRDFTAWLNFSKVNSKKINFTKDKNRVVLSKLIENYNEEIIIAPLGFVICSR